MALVPPVDRPDPRWHVAPWVDLSAYAWSWLPPLLLLLAFGPTHPQDYLLPFALLVGFSTTHRHATIPYVALDRDVFRTAPYAFTLLPALLFVGFLASAWSWHTVWPAGSLGPSHAAVVASIALVTLQTWGALADGHAFRGGPLAMAGLALGLGALGPWPAVGGLMSCSLILAWDQARPTAWLAPGAMALMVAALVAVDPRWPATDLAARTLVEGVAIFAGGWNVWHVLQQKYGILRLYAAKAGGRVPGPVDRFLLFGTLPLGMVGVARQVQPVIDRIGNELTLLQPLVDALSGSNAAGGVAALLAAAAVATFVGHEARAPSWPRVHMALGTVALHLAFLVFPPIKVYIAYATSHAVEYVVFLWAFQRRRYARPLPHDPVMGRIVRSHHTAYWVLFIGVGTVAYALGYHDELWLERAPRVAGLELWRWIFLWGMWQSMAHFAWDSFLWKMRAPSTRAHL